MRTMLLGATALALLCSGCYVEETPQYAPRCHTAACVNVNRAPVVVKVKTPPPATNPAPVVKRRCPAGQYWHPGKAWWNGRRWVQRRGFCRRIPGAYQRRARCFYRRGRWIRVWQGWRRVPGRWVCRR